MRHLQCSIRKSFAPTTNLKFNVPQSRPFLKPADLNSLLHAETPLRHLTHTRVIPYPSSAAFNAIARVENYPTFLPFVISADVSQRDAQGFPSRASLKVGYDALGIEERWDSTVKADKTSGSIEARSADGEIANPDGIFEVLRTKWQLREIEDIRRQGVGLGVQTSVQLDVDVKFRSVVYDKLFAGIEEKVAGMMVGAFEKRIRELAGS